MRIINGHYRFAFVDVAEYFLTSSGHYHHIIIIIILLLLLSYYSRVDIGCMDHSHDVIEQK